MDERCFYNERTACTSIATNVACDVSFNSGSTIVLASVDRR